MARKVVNRKALREEVEAAEAAGVTEKKTTKRKTAKRKSRAKEAVEPPKKLVWTVRNQAGRVVATFEYHDKQAADSKAEALSKDGKTPHFVQRDRLVIEEA